MNQRIRIPACLLMLLASAGAAVAAGPAESLETIDARQHAGKLDAIADGSVAFIAEGKAMKLPTTDVDHVTLADGEDLMQQAGRNVLVTAAGDVLGTDVLVTEDGRFVLRSPLAGTVKVKFADVRTVYLPPATLNSARVQSQVAAMRGVAEATHDVLLVDNKGKGLLAVMGVLVAIGNDRITFRWQDQDRTVERSQVRAVRLASLGSSDSNVAGGTLVGRKGCRIRFRSLALQGDKFSVETMLLGRIEVPRSAVAEVQFASPRVRSLSVMTPQSVREVPFFDLKFPMRRDASVGGGPILLTGKRYDHGLGLHSMAELTYDAGGAYSTFVCLAGIDDSVRPHGNASLVILGDGKPLGEPVALTGKDKPVLVRRDVKGVKTLTVRVDYGADGIDAADHVDLANCRLIK